MRKACTSSAGKEVRALRSDEEFAPAIVGKEDQLQDQTQNAMRMEVGVSMSQWRKHEKHDRNMMKHESPKSSKGPFETVLLRYSSETWF